MNRISSAHRRLHFVDVSPRFVERRPLFHASHITDDPKRRQVTHTHTNVNSHVQSSWDVTIVRVSVTIPRMARHRSSENRALCSRLQKAFGSRLQVARRNAAAGRTNQDAIAVRLGITRTSVSNIERGEHRVFLDQVYLAAHVLGLDARDLLPPMEEVFPDERISSAPDTKIDAAAATELMRIALELQRKAQVNQAVDSKTRPDAPVRRR